LKQTYPFIEVIVIDDGSTDCSLEVIKQYANRVSWETGTNQGGNYARNRGFFLSKGEYIQYLDADDYILPEKIERQVHFLEETDMDVVYGDWRHQQHLPKDKIILEDVKVSGEQSDILVALLSDWWVSPTCLLFRRCAVQKSGGWDESLKAGQDRDFFISVVMSGAKVAYQPGCYSIYRRYGNVTVSSASKTTYLNSQVFINMKVENRLKRAGDFSNKYQEALAQSYFRLARFSIEINSDIYRNLLKKVLCLSPNFKPQSIHRTKIYTVIQNILGFEKLESLVFVMKNTKIFIMNSFFKLYLKDKSS
jgi:glycosyltransferase involved in cell wall biosynthesis